MVLQQVVAPFSKPEVTHNSNRNLSSCFSFCALRLFGSHRATDLVSPSYSRGPTVRLLAFAHVSQKQKEISQSALTAVHLSLVVDELFACFLLVDLFSGCVEDFEFAVLLWAVGTVEMVSGFTSATRLSVQTKRDGSMIGLLLGLLRW